VQKRLMSDVPFGAFLSGGMDSSAIVALMSRYIEGRVNTFTVGFEQPTRLNELEHARAVADRFDTCHHEVLIDEQQAIGYLDQLVYQQDEPIADWVCVPLYFVSKLAHEAGVKVVQVGEGADEQFAGYPNYLRYLQLHKYFWKFFRMLPSPVRESGARLAAQLYKVRPGLAPLSDLVMRAASDRELFWTGAPLFWDIAKSRLLRELPSLDDGFSLPFTDHALGAEYRSEDSFSVVAGFRDSLARSAPDHDILTRMIHSEFRLRLPELLLMRVDKITMSTSLEARVPFLDHSLVELSFDIPQADKVADMQPKPLLKQAFREILPDEIVGRKKQGFGAPMMEWLRGDLGLEVEHRVLGSRCLDEQIFDRRYIRELFVQHRECKQDASKLIWGLFNLTAWYDCWVEGSGSRP
jgi:asparagine synthase (glutamine-hydrolysing)